jgi:hypothetical protein
MTLRPHLTMGLPFRIIQRNKMLPLAINIIVIMEIKSRQYVTYWFIHPGSLPGQLMLPGAEAASLQEKDHTNGDEPDRPQNITDRVDDCSLLETSFFKQPDKDADRRNEAQPSQPVGEL